MSHEKPRESLPKDVPPYMIRRDRKLGNVGIPIPEERRRQETDSGYRCSIRDQCSYDAC